MPKTIDELMYEARRPTSLPLVPSPRSETEGLHPEVAEGVPADERAFPARRERSAQTPTSQPTPAVVEPEEKTEPPKESGALDALAEHYRAVGPAPDRLAAWRDKQPLENLIKQVVEGLVPTPEELDFMAAPGGTQLVAGKKLATLPINWFLGSFGGGDAETIRVLATMAKEQGSVTGDMLAPEFLAELKDNDVLHGLWAGGVISDTLYADRIHPDHWVTLGKDDAGNFMMTLAEDAANQVYDRLKDPLPIQSAE